MSWFNVPGQFCPIAMGSVPCETNYDCTQKLNMMSTQNPACSQLTGPTTGLGWTDTAAVQNSAAGNLVCHPVRGVCTMENFEISDSKELYLYLIIILAIALTTVFIILFMLMMSPKRCDIHELVNCIATGYNVTRK